MRLPRWLLVTVAIGAIVAVVAVVVVARHDGTGARHVATTGSPTTTSSATSISTSLTTIPSSATGETSSSVVAATTSSSSVEVTVPDDSAPTEQTTTTTNTPVLDDSPLLFQQGNGVYAVNADGTAQTLLFETDLTQNRDWFYRWSPDHRRLANENDGGNDMGIVVRDRDGTNVHVVATGGVGDPAWSPDGTRLAFRCQNDNGATGICVVGLDGSAPVHLTPDECCAADLPDWSPDGTRIVFRRQHNDATQSLAVIDLATNVVTDIYSATPNSSGYAPFVQLPQWSPTGDLIAFEQEGDNTQTDLWVVGTDGTDAHAIVTNPKGTFPRWSPDGQRIAFSPYSPETSLIWIVNRDGTGGTSVPGLVRDPNSPPFDDW